MATESSQDQLNQTKKQDDSNTSNQIKEQSMALLRTPPLLDPTTRFSTLTPNITEMINDLSHYSADSQPPISDILSSPDPSAYYNALNNSSPVIKDLYNSHGIITPIILQHEGGLLNQDALNERKAKTARVSAEISALFNTPSFNPSQNQINLEENNRETITSVISSPDIMKTPSLSDKKDRPSLSNRESTNDNNCEVNSSSETPPPQENSTHSPSESPQPHFMTSRNEKQRTKRSRTKSPNTNEKADVDDNKTRNNDTNSSQITVTSSPTQITNIVDQSKQIQLHPVPTIPPTHHPALAMSNAQPFNTAMLGLLPFTQGISPAMPQHLMAAPGTIPFPARSMTFVPGANGGEMIPMDIFARATALQYSAVQAVHAANAARAAQAVHAAHAVQAAQAVQAVQNMQGVKPGNLNPLLHPFLQQSTQNDKVPKTEAQLEPISGSRKKRRRQMLERSACSEEQARENRARALSRLRQKKTLHNQSTAVRYACRKRIAMVRPRVNGRFATKEEAEENQKTQM